VHNLLHVSTHNIRMNIEYISESARARERRGKLRWIALCHFPSTYFSLFLDSSCIWKCNGEMNRNVIRMLSSLMKLNALKSGFNMRDYKSVARRDRNKLSNQKIHWTLDNNNALTAFQQSRVMLFKYYNASEGVMCHNYLFHYRQQMS
jgi:hypothetical protein